MSERVCTNCAYCVHSGTGYSEWTITGEELICAKSRRESLDTEYATDAQMEALNKVAAECPDFVEGEGPRLGLYSEDDEKEWKAWSEQTGLPIPESY